MNKLKTFENFINEEKEYPHDKIAEKIYNYIVKNQDTIEIDKYGSGINFDFRIDKPPKKPIIDKNDPYGEEEWEEDDDDTKNFVLVFVTKTEGMFGMKDYYVSVDNVRLQLSKKLAKKIYNCLLEIRNNRSKIKEEEEERRKRAKLNQGIDFLNKEIV